MTSESVRFRVGDFACVSLPDVIETLREEDIENMFNTDAERMLAAFRVLPAPLTFCRNILLVDTGKKRVLIDSGMGHSAPNDPGHLLEQLRAENITPESIDTVVISHYDQDHTGGLLDHAGNPTFPNARLVVPGQEHDY
jgi:glyoxylase-like metal-dependent hydrolase (beta-lactamase superfamily II)